MCNSSKPHVNVWTPPEPQINTRSKKMELGIPGRWYLLQQGFVVFMISKGKIWKVNEFVFYLSAFIAQILRKLQSSICLCLQQQSSPQTFGAFWHNPFLSWGGNARDAGKRCSGAWRVWLVRVDVWGHRSHTVSVWAPDPSGRRHACVV